MTGFRCVFVAAALVVLSALPVGVRAQTVIELFTSQGCNSCPPADALLARLDQSDDVFGLTLAVDYWDYLGWKDQFADPIHAQRQRDYQKFLGGGNVYTPQMVIGGAAQVVGSDGPAVRAAIERDRSHGLEPLPVSIEWRDNSMVIDIPSGAPSGDAIVWLVLYDHEQHVKVTAGENGGRRLAYRNVVRKIRRIGSWNGQPQKIILSGDELTQHPQTDSCAVLVQNKGPGPIIGLARMEMGHGTE